MEDLSESAAGSLWTVSMAAGNMSGRLAAMSAPGTAPADPLPPSSDQGDPHVEPVDYNGRHLVGRDQ